LWENSNVCILLVFLLIQLKMVQGYLKSKLPASEEILPVFSVILFLVFSWTLYRVFYVLPAWLMEMTAVEILAVCAYVFSFALLESLFVLGGMALLSLVLPARFFKQKFVPLGSLLTIFLGAAAYLIHPRTAELIPFRLLYLALIPVIVLVGIIVLIFLLALLFERLPAVRRAVTALAERMTIFVYIYLPLGVLSLVVVFLRLLFDIIIRVFTA